MATFRRTLLDKFYAAARGVRIVDGYETDAGEQVSLGEEPGLGPNDPLGIAIAVGDEESKWAQPGLARQARLQVDVHALVSASLEKPWWAVEAVLGDVKRAIEGNAELSALMDWSMETGAVRVLAREPGTTTVGVVVTYYLMWKEGWGRQ